MTIRFGTASGSVYEIDTEQKTWARIIAGDGSTFVRTRGGEYEAMTPILLGCPVIMTGEGLEFGVRVISTTEVMWVWRIDETYAGLDR